MYYYYIGLLAEFRRTGSASCDNERYATEVFLGMFEPYYSSGSNLDVNQSIFLRFYPDFNATGFLRSLLAFIAKYGVPTNQ